MVGVRYLNVKILDLKIVVKIGIVLMLISLNQQVFSQTNVEFVENKGQWDQDIKYKGDINAGSFALKANGGYKMLIYNETDLANLSPHRKKDSSNSFNQEPISKQVLSNSIETGSPKYKLRGHVYDVSFLNANPNPIVIPDKQINSYNNYFIGNDPKKWAGHCNLYSAITYKNIYPNIDLRYYSNNGNLKYDFIVNPGGDANMIVLYFNGADGLKVRDGNLIINTSIREVKEFQPYSYQSNEDGRKEISCSYSIKGNIVKFKLNEKIDLNKTLVIDPLVFSTFTGSKATNWGFTATYDNRGNFYAGGIVFGGGFPVNAGAFQTTYNGPSQGFDIAIMKFNPNGSDRVYATYIGGSQGSEQPHSMVVDAFGNLIISGRTNSGDYPGTRFGTGGLWDIILTKLNFDGSNILGSKIIGGDADDGVNVKDKEVCESSSYVGTCPESTTQNYGDDARSEVIVDAANNIYLASTTQSVNFPTKNAFQNVNGSSSNPLRKQDGILIKISPDFSNVFFSTYLGGKGDDAAFVLALNPLNNDIYVAGATTSTDFPGNKSGPIGAINAGGVCDGFVAIYDNNGALKKSIYYGTPGIDLVYGIQFDKFSFPYIMGTTTGDIPIKNALFSQTKGRQFITKLNQDLTEIIFSTNFGTGASTPNISPTAFLVDRCENIYVSGWGGKGNSEHGYYSAGTKGLPTGGDGANSVTDGSDFYFIVLKKNAESLLFGSFFGQNGGMYPDHVDGGTSRFDRNGIIYQAVCANCGGGARFPTTAGAWSQVNGAEYASGSLGCNLAAIKISFNLAGIGSDLVTTINGRVRDSSGCVPLTVNFEDSSAMGKMYVWDFGDNTKRDTTTISKISHVYQNTGFFKAMLISIDSSSCNISDSSFVNIRVRSDEAILGFDAVKLPPCQSLVYQFTNNSIPPNSNPAKPFKPNSFLWKFGDGTTLTSGSGTFTHTFPAAGTYSVEMVLIDTNYCNELYSIKKTIRIAENVVAKINTPAFGCAPYNSLFLNETLGGTNFIWDFGDNSPLETTENPTHLYNNIGPYTIKLLAFDNSTCNKLDSTFFTINVSSKPQAVFNYTPQPTESNTAVNFINSSIGGVSYKWLFGDGYTLETSKIDTIVKHIYSATDTYNACLKTTNMAGCSDTLCMPISVIINPQVDIPNAFTPNGDGINDKIYVRGYGISEIVWRIYDRWGNQVYTSIDQYAGWDGKYNGRLLAQDVYHYTLQVLFSSGEKYLKKGDITLLR